MVQGISGSLGGGHAAASKPQSAAKSAPSSQQTATAKAGSSGSQNTPTSVPSSKQGEQKSTPSQPIGQQKGGEIQRRGFGSFQPGGFSEKSLPPGIAKKAGGGEHDKHGEAKKAGGGDDKKHGETEGKKHEEGKKPEGADQKKQGEAEGKKQDEAKGTQNNAPVQNQAEVKTAQINPQGKNADGQNNGDNIQAGQNPAGTEKAPPAPSAENPQGGVETQKQAAALQQAEAITRSLPQMPAAFSPPTAMSLGVPAGLSMPSISQILGGNQQAGLGGQASSSPFSIPNLGNSATPGLEQILGTGGGGLTSSPVPNLSQILNTGAGPISGVPAPGQSIGSQLLNQRGNQAGVGSQIINNSVLGAARSGDTAGFISALTGNITANLNNSVDLFNKLTN